MCSRHFNSLYPTLGQPPTMSDNVGSMHSCPPNAPICWNYVANQHYGTCKTIKEYWADNYTEKPGYSCGTKYITHYPPDIYQNPVATAAIECQTKQPQCVGIETDKNRTMAWTKKSCNNISSDPDRTIILHKKEVTPLKTVVDPLKAVVDKDAATIKQLQIENAADNKKIQNLQNTINQDNKTLAAQTIRLNSLQTDIKNDDQKIKTQDVTIKDQLDRIGGLEAETHELTSELASTEAKLDKTKSLGTILALSKQLSSKGVNEMTQPLKNLSADGDVIDNISQNLADQTTTIQDVIGRIQKTTTQLEKIENNYDQDLFEKEQKQILIDTRRGMLVNEKKKNNYNKKLIMFIVSINIILLIFVAIMYIRYMKA